MKQMNHVKSRNWLAILIGMLLMTGLICPSRAEKQLPEEIKSTLAGTEIIQTAYWESPGSTWFVLIRTPDGINVLSCFELRDGSWIRSFQTSAAVPQGRVIVERLHMTDKMQDFTNNRTWPGPILLILTDDGGYTSYQRSDSGQWNLFRVFYPDEQIHLDFDDGSVTYSTPIDQDHSGFETVYGVFERDLRKVDINMIPRSPRQAQEMLNDAAFRVPAEETDESPDGTGMNDGIGEKRYVWEKEGCGGDFTISIFEDGTYEYYEGYLSSYIGSGTWDITDGILTLQENSGYDFIFRFSIVDGNLVFISEGSSRFIYTDVENGDLFILIQES